MLFDSPLIVMLVFGIGLAFILGALAHRLSISPIVGYLLAGVVLGPFTPGLVVDAGLASQLADVGVVLLMFGVGLHFSLKDILSVRAIVVPGAVMQVAATTALGTAVGWFLGWGIGAGVVFGLALAVASTVVLMRALQEWHLLETERGHVVAGWLIMQDFLTVLALVLLPPLAGLLKNGAGQSLDWASLAPALGATIAKLITFAALMLFVGRRVIPAILHYVAHTGSRELFRLAVLSVALTVAFLAAEMFDVSFALGAFFGGMILSESQLSQRAAEESLPLRDAFAVLFFVSVGMLFNPAVLLSEWDALAAALAAVVFGNMGAAYLIVRLFRRPKTDALLIAVGLAQIGEFSFILADLGIGLDLLPVRARDLILGTSILSIFLNPVLFSVVDRIRAKLEPPPLPEAEPIEIPPTRQKDHAVLVGYGRVGQLVGESLIKEGWPLVVIEDATDIVEKLRTSHVEVIVGNAADERVLKAANLAETRLLFVAIPNGFEAGQIVRQARTINPNIDIVARAHFDAEVEHLEKNGANAVIMGEREIARAMLEHARAQKTVLAGGAATP
jgi:CPA2 family monovalent cation:H+ antiporter-2